MIGVVDGEIVGRRRDKLDAVPIGIRDDGAAAPFAIGGSLDDGAAGFNQCIQVGIHRIHAEADAHAGGGARLRTGGIDLEDIAVRMRLGGEVLGTGAVAMTFEVKAQHAVEALGAIKIRRTDDDEIQQRRRREHGRGLSDEVERLRSNPAQLGCFSLFDAGAVVASGVTFLNRGSRPTSK